MTGGRRIGLLGGTFDPPHVGHLIIAECARVSLGLEEMRFVVAGQPWMKDEFTDGAHRLAMTRLAVAPSPAFLVDDRELRRDGPTYTADTLEELAAEAPEASFTFVVGADAAASLPQWRRVEDAMALATFVVAPRPGYTVEPPEGVGMLAAPALDLSSTEVRRRFAAGEATRYQVPLDVEAYIRDHGLYGVGAR